VRKYGNQSPNPPNLWERLGIKRRLADSLVNLLSLSGNGDKIPKVADFALQPPLHPRNLTMSKNLYLVGLIMFGALVITGTAAAQTATDSNKDLGVTKPRSTNSGFTRNELRNIYQQDIGQGFTSQSLNSIALRNAQARVGYVGQTTPGTSGAARSSSISSLAPGRSAKPFNSVSSSPTVSPYMNLFREDLDGNSDLNYQTLVRPQFQQMQQNQQFERQNMELNYKVQSISAQSAFQNPAGSENVYPTGHQTAFGYYGRYYPTMGQPQRGR
jgi:hypothetical protein